MQHDDLGPSRGHCLQGVGGPVEGTLIKALEMLASIRGDLDGGVAKEGLQGFGVDPAFNAQGGEGMPQVVEADFRQSGRWPRIFTT